MLRRPWLLVAPAATLIALAAAALLTLAPAAAEPPPADLALKLSVDDVDGVIRPGQEFTVSAELVYTGARDPLAPGQLRVGGGRLGISGGGNTEFDIGRRSLKLNAFSVNEAQTIASFTPIELRDEDGDPVPNQAWAWIRAMDGRTALISRSTANRPSGFGGSRVFVYDLLNRRQSITINPPPGANAGWSGFGHSQTANAAGGRVHNGTAVAVWHENEAVAWVFVGSHNDAHHGNANTGSVYVFKLDWATNPPTYELRATLFPSEEDACNTSETSCPARFGTALTISPDGRALAVGADRINEEMGAVYVYMRPESAGSWGDVRHENAIKVTTVAVPPWGSGATTAPFTYTSTGRTGAATDCDAYCSRAFAADGQELGKRQIRFSRNAEVLLVAAQEKDFDSRTPGGGFSNPIVDTGEAYVFVAPGGDWAAHAHDATVDAQGNPKTLIGAKEDARAFDPDTHYSPGPRLRVTEPTAVLIRRPWSDSVSTLRDSWFGQMLDLTLDGRTVAVGTGWDFNIPTNNPGRGRVAIYQLEADETWQQLGADNPGGLIPDAQLEQHNVWQPLFPSQIGFSADGETLLMGHPTYGTAADQGAVFMQRRPADGRWASGRVTTGLSDWNGVWWETPPPNRGINYSSFAYFTFSLDRQRLSLNSLGYRAYDLPSYIVDGGGVAYNRVSGPGRSYLSDERCTTWPTDQDGFVEPITTCRIVLPNARVFVPLDTPDGTFQILATLSDVQLGDDAANAVPLLSSSLELEIGTVKEVAEAKLEFGANTRFTTSTTDDTIWPATIAAGETTTLRLQILTERGKLSSADSVSSLIASTQLGSLSSNLGAAPGCRGGAGAICRLNASALTDGNSGNILLTLRHGGTAGTTNVSVRVLGKAGEEVRSNVVAVTLTGPPTTLAIDPPSAAVLNLGTPDSGADKDDRDLLTLAVSAADQAGRRVDAPTNRLRARLTGPDGQRVMSGVELEWPLGGADNPTLNADGERQVRVNVNRAAAQPLANGEYTLEVRAGSLSATQTFIVGGGPATLSLSEVEGTLAEGEQVSLTAIVLDADGNSVPDGTSVNWSATDVGTTAVLVQLSAEARTTDGQASATWLVLSAGSAAVRAQAGAAVDLRLLDVAAALAAAAEPPSPADGLRRASPGLATWVGEGRTSAAALLDDLPGVDSILFWSNSENRWWRYARSNGQPVPGSVNFEVVNGAVLWIAG